MSLIILTLNWCGKEKLEKLAPTLLASLENIGCSWSWLVKDNASGDRSMEYLNSLNNPNIEVFDYPNNQQNFSEGCNYLFNIASPSDNDYIMLLNNDIIFNDTTSIKNMLSIIQKDNSVGMVGARLLYTGTNKLQHAGVIFVPEWRTPDNYRHGELSDKDAELNRTFQAVTGAVCITKAEYYRNICKTNKSKINGLSESLIWCFDDIDAAMEIKYNMQKKIVYCGSTNIFHEESASLKKNPVNKLFLNHNLKYFFQKWTGRYDIDRKAYTENPKHNLYLG
jgi:GT2 family glycosyltransferase